MRHRGRVGMLVAVAGGLVALSVMVLASVAVAQEYGGSTGQLRVAGLAVPRGSLEVSGEGFMADSVVRLMLTDKATGVTIDLGVLESDASGVLAASVALPAGLEPGAFALSATGVTTDGATRVLSADVQVTAADAGDGAGESSGGMPALAIAGIVALLVVAAAGGGWWLIASRRRR